MKFEKEELKEEIVDWVKEYLGEIIAGFGILIIVLLLLLIKGLKDNQLVISVLGCICIIVIVLEKRASAFDKTVSTLVIFFLSVGFMLLG